MNNAIQAFFQRYFKIRTNEFLLVQAFFLYYVCIGMFIVVGISAGDSLLLTKASPQNAASLYAWMHIVIAIVSILVTYLYDSVMGILSRTALLVGTQLLLLLSIQLFQHMLISKSFTLDARVYFILAVWLRVCARILIMLFFSFAGDYFNAHEAKRLYAYIAGGLPVGIVGAGVITRKLVTVMEPENMLYVCMGFLSLGIVFSFFIYKKGVPIVQQEYFTKSKKSKIPLRTIVGQSYIQLVFLVVLTGMLCFVIVDAQMKLSARDNYPNSADLAAFFGSYYAYVGMLEVVFQFLFVEFLLRRHGIIRSLMILPCIHIIMSTLFYSTGFGVLAHYTLLIIVTAAFFQDVFSDSLILPSRELLFLPLSPPLRLRSQAIMSGIVVPLGQGIGGLCIIALIRLDVSLTRHSLLSFSIAVGWIALLLILQPRYRDMLGSSLKSKQLDGETLQDLARNHLLEPVLLEVFRHPKKQLVSLSLTLLHYRSPHGFSSSILTFADDSRPEIATKAIELLGSAGKIEHLMSLERKLQSPSSLIRKATVLAICRIKKEEALPNIDRWLESPDQVIRYAALIGCGRYCGEQGRHRLQPLLKKLVSDRQTEQRRLAASLLRDIGDPTYAPLVEILLDDHDLMVRIVAVKACASIQSPILVAHLLRLYHSSELRTQVLQVLEQMPEEYIPTISNAAQNLNLDQTAANLLLRVLGTIGGRTAQKQLWKVFSGHSPLSVRVAAGNALWRIALREPLQEVSERELEKTLQSLCMNIEQLNQGCAEIANSQNFIWQLLHDQARLEIECLFQLLSFKYNIQQLEKVQHNFFSSGPRQQANALELLDDILPRPLAPRIGELLDAFLQKSLLHGRKLSAGTIQHLMRMERRLKVAMRYYRHTHTSAGLNGNEREFSRHIEKIAFLKNIPLFQEVAVNYLHPLAEIAGETRLRNRETLFCQGDRADAMYLIRRGRIDIEVNGVVVNQMGPGDCIGEMAILDDTRRTASCIAWEESELFKISEQHFQVIVKSQASVALAVLRILTKRLRQQTESMIAQSNLQDFNRDQKRQERHTEGLRTDDESTLFHLLKKIALLKDLPLFKNVPENYLVPIARVARSNILKKGEVLFHQGEQGHAIYFICHGSIGVQVNGVELSCLRAGNCLGEMAILDGEPRSASCIALEESELLSIAETDFEIILKSQTSVALALLKILARKLHRQTRNTIRQQRSAKF